METAISKKPDTGSTQVYKGDALSAVRPRQALVAEGSYGSSAELTQLLRKRLLIVATAGAIVSAADNITHLATKWADVADDMIGLLASRPAYVTEFFIVVGFIPLAVVLASRHHLTVGRLRLIEAVMFGFLVVTCAADTWAISLREIRLRMLRGNTVANAELIMWFSCIVIYGVLIPNTARRCLTVVAIIVACCATCAIGSWLYFGAPPERLVGWTTNLILWLGIGVAITVSGAHWSDELRRQAQEARQLGQYVLRRVLGTGGMGEVYYAEHRLLRRPAAIKLIHPDRAGDPKNLLRFEREVQATATLTHPNTVQVFDYGHAEDGTFYYVMEYLAGPTLDQLVQKHGPLPHARAIHFLRQISAALREAHGIGLIHRDIKPGNVIVCERGGMHDVVKLLDFGLVLPLHGESADEKLTRQDVIAGTPDFMSPEQAAAQEVIDARSDIYAVGALAYYLLTGKPPFAGRSGIKVLAAHLYEQPVAVTKHQHDVPSDLEDIVHRCLAKDPADRFPDAESLELALATCEGASQWTSQQAAAWWHSQNGLYGQPDRATDYSSVCVP